MWKVKSLKISNLWEESDYNIDFNAKLNIFIGSNGIGKTTILRILNSALKVDALYFRKLLFKSIKILLINENLKQKTLRIEKDEDGVHFFLSNRAIYQEDDESEDVLFTAKQRRNRINELKLREQVQSQLEISPIHWLPTNRLSLEEEILENDFELRSNFYNRFDAGEVMNPIDFKLKLLIEKANLEISKINQLIVAEDIKFRDNMVERNFIALSNVQEESGSTTRFQSALKVLRNDKDRSKMLEKLENIKETVLPSLVIDFKGIDSVKKKLISPKNDKEVRYTIGDVMKISAFSFLIQYVDDFDNYNKTLKGIRYPLENLKTNFNNIFDEKFDVATINKCLFYKKNNQESEEFKFENFSSGEKQILIFILECALHLNTPCLYLADEPEISLHLKWQQKYLDTLLSTHNENQIFIATHSPDIVGRHKKSIISLNKMVENKNGRI